MTKAVVHAKNQRFPSVPRAAVAEVVFSSGSQYLGYLEDGTGFYVEPGTEIYFDATPTNVVSRAVSQKAHKLSARTDLQEALV